MRRLVLALAGVPLALISILSASAAPSATITVTTTADTVASDGKCSLREAIQAANNNAAVRECPAGTGADTIQFSLGSGTPTIAVTGSGLPAITAALIINGNTGGATRIELNGAGANTGVNGLTAVNASTVTLKALVINRFDGNGIELRGGGKHRVTGSLIGTDKTGTAASANKGAGIYINSSTLNTIGGSNAADRNVISGNLKSGIQLDAAFNAAQTPGSNTILGNNIGVNAAGTAALANSLHGILVEAGGGNLIGGTAGITVGGACTGACNLISGNFASGIEIETDHTNIQGNLIGTNGNGTAALGNGEAGVGIIAGNSNTVGGTTPAARNIISGNGTTNIVIISNPHDNVVKGNFIGTAVNGSDPLPAGDHGILISGGADNVIGGTAGTTPGGACTGACNLISGNDKNGIFLVESVHTVIQGNFVGTDLSGTAARGNTLNGIDIVDAGNNTIGGTSANARNLISGNLQNGIAVETAHLALDPSENTIAGNFVGTNTGGTAALANGQGGVALRAGSNNTVGGATGTTPGGACTGACNLVSGNSGTGIAISADNNTVQGNLIGTTVNGSAALGNTGEGIRIQNGSGNIVGGTTAAARNLISANHLTGISLITSNNNTVQGNRIGDNAAGFGILGNTGAGVLVQGSTGNTIGGTTGTTPGGACTGACNNIAGNLASGLVLLDSAQTNVQGNFFGMNADGDTVAGGNLENGVSVEGTSGSNTIGGTTPAARNLISGNSENGVSLQGSGSSNVVEGNFIGTDTTGTGQRRNVKSGVFVCAANNTIGGSVAGAGNLISGNLEHGVHMTCDGSSANRVLGNFIGTNATGTGAVGNTKNGVFVGDTGAERIGGAFGALTPGNANLIAFNGESGVLVNSTDRVSVRFNSIFSNGAPEINLSGGNNNQAAPVLTSATPGSTHVTGALAAASSTTFALDFYSTPDCAHPQGKTYLGSKDVTTDTNGNVNFTADLTTTAPGGSFVTATATDPNGNTSRFSACAQMTGPTATPPPVCTGKPAKPLLLAPANNGVVHKPRVNLTWNAADCAETYKVLVKDKATGQKVASSPALTVLHFKTKALVKGKIYKWFVKACRAGQCIGSAKRTFTLQ